MSSVKRRGVGRPNRGGGAQQQQQQQRKPHNVPRKSRAFDAFDDYDDYGEGDDDPPFELAAEAAVATTSQPPVPEHMPKRKVDMQIVHMSSDAQSRLEKTLTELHGGNSYFVDQNEYKDSGRRLDRRFWIHDRQLLVRGVEGSALEASVVQESPFAKSEHVTKFSLAKLSSFGFHTSRCAKALHEAKGDVGAALENLLTECFSSEGATEERLAESEVIFFNEQKEDEKMALESIYGEAFTERIAGKVWEIKLELAALERYTKDEEKSTSSRSKGPSNDEGVCQFFARGYCKFGKRCHKRHVQRADARPAADDRHLRIPSEPNASFLEIRFPDAIVYPRHAPLVAFRTDLTRFPKNACLNVTAKLADVAKAHARDQAPSIFAMVSVLEDEAVMAEAVAAQSCAFSFDENLVPRDRDGPDETELGEDQTEEAVTSEDIPRDKGSRSIDAKRQLNKMLQDNLRIRKRCANRSIDPKIQSQRQSLPAWKSKDIIVDTIKKNQVVVISGDTGCGKSTQVPQYVLDDWLSSSGRDHCHLVCTQPRRISAVGVADRVAVERNERTGAVVGYQIRLESKMSADTRLLFCTTGILLRRMEADPLLEAVTHVVIDEVHERSEESDFLLMCLRRVLTRRPDLRLILMSATVNAGLFSRYFSPSAPVITIEGRTFPVQHFFLEEALNMTGFAMEDNSPFAKADLNRRKGPASQFISKEQIKGGNMRDVFVDDAMLERDMDSDESFKPAKDSVHDEKLSMKQIMHRFGPFCDERACGVIYRMDVEKINYDLLEAVLVFIADGKHSFPREGSIVVFLPGMQEISTLHDQLAAHPLLGKKANKFELIPLHSSLSSEEQARVFAKCKLRKIVISTNLAETSITIDDCVFVVDSGRMKEKAFDPVRNMESLDTVWVSRANALQRKGRAGRVMPGVCFSLFTSFRFEHHMRKDPVPEVLRVPLEAMILRIKTMLNFKGSPLSAVLSWLIEAPESTSVSSAVDRLRGVGALDPEEELTPLGFHLAALPVDVRIGKLILFGSIFRCVDAAITIAAALAYRSPFQAPFGMRDALTKKKLEFAVNNSDHIAVLRAYQAWHSAAEKSQYSGYLFAQENLLSQKTLQTLSAMKQQLLELLSDLGFVTEGLTARRLSRMARNGADAVKKATGDDLNANGNNYKVVLSVLCAALYPNVVQVLSPEVRYKQTASGAMQKPAAANELRFKTRADGYVNVHPSSVCHNVSSFSSAYLVYHERIKTSRVFVRELSVVPLLPMILFGGGGGVSVQLQEGRFVLSLEAGWIQFVTATHRMAELLRAARKELDLLLEEKIAQPQLDLAKDHRGRLIIDTIVHLLSTE